MNSDSMNQPVWNAARSPRGASSSTPKVRKSKTDEIGPKISMNRWMRVDVPAGRDGGDVGSIVSVGIAVCDAS